MPIGFPMYDTRIMKIGNTMEEIALPNTYMNKYLTLHLLSVKHLSLSRWEEAKLKMADCEIPENTFILNCILSYESAPFEESKFSKEWINWDLRYSQLYSSIKANLEDISKEPVVGVDKKCYLGNMNGLIEFTLDDGNSVCAYTKEEDEENMYLYVYDKNSLKKLGEREKLEKCKQLSGLSGWYDLHKDL